MSTDSGALKRVFRVTAILVVGLSSLLLPPSVKRPISASAGESLALEHPDTACAGCHKEIYDRYERKSMARGSGLAENGLISGGFTHAASGIAYKLFLRDGKAWLSYDRASATAPLHGEQQLLYFVGSGLRGRTYLFEQSGFWFEAPVNFYSKAQVWDMAPAYGRATTMPFTLQVDSNCLRCHASEVQNSVKSARNRYDGAPFHAGGVGCVACHGDPTAHLAKGGTGPIINPSKLTAARRDSVCLQCHLEGDAAIYRAGKSSVPFHPGEDLSDDAVYFVNTSRPGFGNRATSQYEALLRSACKRGSGDRLTCTTCHDPHSSPTAEERVNFYRSKCLSCHSGATFAKTHHPEQQDCAVCHMPTRKSDDISHEQLTDHDIEKQPASALLASLDRPATNLVAVGNVVAGDREFGLAYASLARSGDQVAGEKALRLLLKAEKAGADDADVHVQLGFLQQISGNRDGARTEYEAALGKDAYEPTAGANLAVLDATSGRLGEAVRLLQRVVEDDPSQTAAGLNLAFIECKMGQATKAKETLALLRRFNPDSAPLRQFAESGEYSGQRCEMK
jgi:tetratricopeptide (TPR) repeat protein